MGILCSKNSPIQAQETPFNLSAKDEAFLEKIEKDSTDYFLTQIHRRTGLVKDGSRGGAPASIAATGFGLTVLCIADYRKWISHEKAYKTVYTIIRSFMSKIDGKKGFYYHFVDPSTGKRVWQCELSSIDTGLFLCGALFAAEYFGKKQLKILTNRLYQKVDWNWMQNGSDFLSMGWKPETGFLRSYWDAYSELMLLYALAIGSERNNLPVSSWYRWKRSKDTYKNYSYVYCGTGSLFVYQYSHAWIDFRKIKDTQTDWWENSVLATKANRAYCIALQDKFKSFNKNSWGLTACLGPDGYKGYGGQLGYYPVSDGTVAPSAVTGSLPFAPKECIAALKHMYHNHKKKLYGKYGFKNGYNLDKNWFSDEFLGIDQGITVLMIENLRSGLVWKYFMRTPGIKKWMQRLEEYNKN